nr:PREDICTED: proton myo-inositol cotransporter-like [Apteryx mantelli mantelli]
MTVPVYIAEVAPPHLRGRLVTINTLFITGGQFFASVVDGLFSYLAKDGWRYMLGLSAVPAVIQFLGFLFLPESPRWLIQKGQTQRARRILSQMRGNQAIDEEYDSIKNNIEEEEKEVGADKKQGFFLYGNSARLLTIFKNDELVQNLTSFIIFREMRVTAVGHETSIFALEHSSLDLLPAPWGQAVPGGTPLTFVGCDTGAGAVRLHSWESAVCTPACVGFRVFPVKSAGRSIESKD